MKNLFGNFSLIPVVVIDNLEDAVPLATSLLEGGVKAIEITLRTEVGLAAIEKIAKEVPDILLGSGTILNAVQLQSAHDAGAKFHVSPGITDVLAAYAREKNFNWLAGVANASNIMQALAYNFDYVKFFPASLSGGLPMLKQFASVFPKLNICPTGGIDESNFHEYKALPNVFAVGGSWLTPKDLIKNKDWQAITKIAKNSTAKL
jgi:2-dehydro-3-deoxyphosphogluconate aldolase/(4S)-4-hydroxy-2-oxoglutarate aldolase